MMELRVQEKDGFREYCKVQCTSECIIDALFAKIYLYSAKNITMDEKFNDERVK